MIWTDELKQLVINMWGEVEPHVIYTCILDRCALRAIHNGKTSYQIPTIGGVIWKAFEAGFIDEVERDELRGKYKRRPLSRMQSAKILARDNLRCVVCHASKNLEIDHIIPRFISFDDSDRNLQTLCKTCHKIKGLNQIDCQDLRKKTLDSDLWRAQLEDGYVREIRILAGGKYAGWPAAQKLVDRMCFSKDCGC